MTITNNAQSLLSRHPLFRSLAPEQLQRATQGASVIELARNQHLFEQGDRAEFFYYLLEGQVTLSRFSPDGDIVARRWWFCTLPARFCSALLG